MAVLTNANIETRARTATNHDTDDQATSAQILAWVDDYYQQLWFQIAAYTPEALSKTGSTQVLTAAAPTYTVAADFSSIIRFERLEGTIWVAVDVADELNPDLTTGRGFRFEGGTIVVYPSTQAPGSYRLRYVPTPVLAGTYSLLLPMQGMEQWVIKMVSAEIKERLFDDAGGAKLREDAENLWCNPQRPGTGFQTQLRRRYGSHPRGGFLNTKGDP